MSDPGTSDTVSTFFYGLFMDAALLERKGVRALDPRIARLDNHRLSIGARATLVPADAQSVYGILMGIPEADLQRLYSEASVSAYRAQTVTVVLKDGARVQAACYTLPSPPNDAAANREYAAQLHSLAQRLGLPQEYLARIRQAGANNGV